MGCGGGVEDRVRGKASAEVAFVGVPSRPSRLANVRRLLDSRREGYRTVEPFVDLAVIVVTGRAAGVVVQCKPELRASRWF